MFTPRELDYLLGDRRLARLATVGADGFPHVAPVGMWSYDPGSGTIEIRGRALERTKKFRDVRRSHRAALVVDDVLPPWQPRGIEVRGEAEAVSGENGVIRIHPRRIVSWGIEDPTHGQLHARDVDDAPRPTSSARNPSTRQR
jgi:pyridoxamine 5'-phosphate oxidase family protein